jgi:hypothetical protein
MALFNFRKGRAPDAEPETMQTVKSGIISDAVAFAEGEAEALTKPSGLGDYTLGMLNKPSKVIGKEQIAEAMSILQKYQNSKAMLDARIVEEEDFYMRQYYQRIKKAKGEKVDGETPSSAWLFNSLHNKHADMMDSAPAPICLPRELSDEEEAKKLTSILPVIFEYNKFKKTYSKESWYKLKHGISAYSVLWNPEKDNGLGDIEIGRPDILKLYWDMSVTDIQQSRHFFAVDFVDNEVLESQYEDLRGKLGQSNFKVMEYRHNNNSAELNTEKSLVVDWYYKKKVRGMDVVHYCKFCNDTVLYASENNPDTATTGFYEHGKYPFVIDILFPEEGSASGFGFIAIGREPQIYIDLLDKISLDYAFRSANPRYYISDNVGVNEEEFGDWSKTFVHVKSPKIDEERLREITLPSFPTFISNHKESKINELKECTSNRDFSQGSTASGVTSGAAIATLQEAGNKTSRDTINGTYMAYEEICVLAIELIRQFYTEERSFRITAPNSAGYKFVTYNNQNLQMQPQFTQSADGTPIALTDEAGNQLVRKPIIDIKVKAQKQSPFTTLAQNETAMNLYSAGFFNPENAQPAMLCLDMMDFEGKEEIMEQIKQGETLYNQVMQLNQQVAMVSQALVMAGIDPAQFGLQPIMPEGGVSGGGINSENPIVEAQGNARAASRYTESLIEKARP